MLLYEIDDEEVIYCIMGERMVRFIRYSVIILGFRTMILCTKFDHSRHCIQCLKKRVVRQLKMYTSHTGLLLTATHAIYQIRLETVYAASPSVREPTHPHIERFMYSYLSTKNKDNDIFVPFSQLTYNTLGGFVCELLNGG